MLVSREEYKILRELRKRPRPVAYFPEQDLIEDLLNLGLVEMQYGNPVSGYTSYDLGVGERKLDVMPTHEKLLLLTRKGELAVKRYLSGIRLSLLANFLFTLLGAVLGTVLSYFFPDFIRAVIAVLFG